MYKLIIEDDEGKTTVVPLIRDEITIGRKEGNTIRLTERNVSRRHAKLSRSNGTIYIEDLQSYNGIRVNGDRIAGRAPITEGDRVQIGDYQLALKLDKSVPGPDGDGDEGKTTPFIKNEDAPTRAQPILAAPAPAATAAMPAPSLAAADSDRPGRLVVISSNFAGKEFRLDKAQSVIGRTDENDIVINHRSISRHHAKIVRDNGRYQVVDLGSANGVRVNGEEYGKSDLRKGDVIDLGHVRLRFVAPTEDFVFARDAQVVDVGSGGGEKKSPVALIAGGVALVLVLGGVAFVMTRDKGDGPKGDSGGAKTGEIVAEVDKAIAALDWDTALTKAGEGLALDANSSALRERKTKAESEKKVQSVYDQYAKASRAADNETAVMRYLEIPENSVYHDKAQETWAVIKSGYIREHSEKARELLAANNCADAKKHVEAVLMVDDANAAVIEIANKCGQPTPTPRSRPAATPPRPARPAGERVAGGSKVEDNDTPSTPPPAPAPTPPPAPRPAPAPVAAAAPDKPAAPAAAAADPEVDAAMKAADDAWVHGQYSDVVAKTQQILKKSPNNTRAWRLYGASQCALKEADGARQAWNHLGNIERKFLQYMCNRSNITLP